MSHEVVDGDFLLEDAQPEMFQGYKKEEHSARRSSDLFYTPVWISFSERHLVCSFWS